MTKPTFFDESHAATYDDTFVKLSAFKDAMHLVTRLALAELPADARVLCVGAGTGAELLYLAEAFPGWRFTAVDPSEPMLRRCRARAEAAGIGARCRFHDGVVASLPEDERGFDGATSLLVSQFLVDPEARRRFFADVAERLAPGAPLVLADLASPAEYDLMPLWKRAWLHAGVPPERVEKLDEAYGTHVAVLPPGEVVGLVRAAGFEDLARCFQTVLIHGWVARRAA